MADVEWHHWPLAPAAPPPLLAGAGASLRQVQLAAGTVAARHAHEHEQFLLVVAGSGTLQCQAGEVPLLPGTVIRLAAGAWHSAMFTEATVLLEVNLKP